MVAPYTIWSVAVFESKILMRAWSFRIFTLIGLIILGVMNLVFGTNIGREPYYTQALSGSLPMMNIKLLNVYQGVIAAFLASDFIKRDRKHDSTQVIYMRSMTNADYILGKTLGILYVFALLNAIVLLISLFFHVLFADTPFAWQPYVYFTIFMSLPTLTFMVGMAAMLMNLVRSQAVTFVLLLGFSMVSLIFLGNYVFQIFDVFAFHLPMMWSDMIGLGNLDDLLAVRGSYFLIGIGLTALSIVFLKRLIQSKTVNVIALVVAIVTIVASVALATGYLAGKYESRDYRDKLRTLSGTVSGIEVPTVKDCSIELENRGETLDMTARLVVANDNTGGLDSLLFSINPGLRVSEVTDSDGSVRFDQNEHLLWIKCATSLEPGMRDTLSISYSGHIDQRACYLDLSDERVEEVYRFYMFTIPKAFSIVKDKYILLTPEAQWYPVSGLSDAAAYPEPVTHDFVNFELDVKLDRGLTAISQGARTIDTTSSGLSFGFKPETPLPQISLVVGRYEERSVEVDSVLYSLYFLPGHNYFDEYFDKAADTIPQMIREIKIDYEMQIELTYPYGRLSVVEVPVQFYCHDRLWTFAQEMVQPQVVYMPELGTIGDATNFSTQKRISTRRQERANLEESPEEIQARYFNNFVKIDLLGIEVGRGGISDDGEAEIEPRFHILPNYVSYSMHLSSEKRPVINYALESYVFNKATPPQDVRWRSWRGLTDMERGNLLLRQHSLKDIIAGDFDNAITSAILKEKGRYLFTLLEAYVGSDAFDQKLGDFLTRYRFQDAPADSFFDSFQDVTEIDLNAFADGWFNDTILPGYNIEDIEVYQVLDGERTRSQVKFSISNPQPVEGVVTAGFRIGRRRDSFMPWWRRGSQKYDFEKMIVVPPESKKEIGIVFDDQPSEMNIETFVSSNIPSVLRKRYRDVKLKKNEVPFDGERLVDLENEPIEGADEFIVDNEDAGFEVVTVVEESRFRKFLLGLFGSDESDDDPYQGLWFWRPPKHWVATTDSRFYGKFVHSAVYKESGEGDQIVSWTADLDEGGTYDVYAYNPGIEEPRWGRRNRNRQDRGEQTYRVHHDDGVEEVVLDLNLYEEGWSLLGTYHISEGGAIVEMTDKNTKTLVIADAVKWVRK